MIDDPGPARCGAFVRRMRTDDGGTDATRNSLFRFCVFSGYLLNFQIVLRRVESKSDTDHVHCSGRLIRRCSSGVAVLSAGGGGSGTVRLFVMKGGGNDGPGDGATKSASNVDTTRTNTITTNTLFKPFRLRFPSRRGIHTRPICASTSI